MKKETKMMLSLGAGILLFAFILAAILDPGTPAYIATSTGTELATGPGGQVIVQQPAQNDSWLWGLGGYMLGRNSGGSSNSSYTEHYHYDAPAGTYSRSTSTYTLPSAPSQVKTFTAPAYSRPSYPSSSSASSGSSSYSRPSYSSSGSSSGKSFSYSRPSFSGRR